MYIMGSTDDKYWFKKQSREGMLKMAILNSMVTKNVRVLENIKRSRATHMNDLRDSSGQVGLKMRILGERIERKGFRLCRTMLTIVMKSAFTLSDVGCLESFGHRSGMICFVL